MSFHGLKPFGGGENRKRKQRKQKLVIIVIITVIIIAEITVQGLFILGSFVPFNKALISFEAVSPGSCVCLVFGVEGNNLGCPKSPCFHPLRPFSSRSRRLDPGCYCYRLGMKRSAKPAFSKLFPKPGKQDPSVQMTRQALKQVSVLPLQTLAAASLLESPGLDRLLFQIPIILG